MALGVFLEGRGWGPVAATESSEGDTPPRRVGAQPRARAGRGQEKLSRDTLGRPGGWVAVGSTRGWASPAWLLPPSLLEARGGGLHAGKSAVSRWPGPVPGLAPSHPRPFPGCGWRAGAGPDPLRDPRRGASRDPERGHAGEGWTQLPRGGGRWPSLRPALCLAPSGERPPGSPCSPPGHRALEPGSGGCVPRTAGQGPGSLCLLLCVALSPPQISGTGVRVQGRRGRAALCRAGAEGRCPGGVGVSRAPHCGRPEAPQSRADR